MVELERRRCVMKGMYHDQASADLVGHPGGYPQRIEDEISPQPVPLLRPIHGQARQEDRRYGISSQAHAYRHRLALDLERAQAVVPENPSTRRRCRSALRPACGL